MAEQLSNDVYKPWMQINCNSLKIQDVEVVPGGGSNAYFAPNIVSSAVLNPPYSEYNLTYAPKYGSGFTINPAGDGVVCEQSGVYNFALTVNQEYSSDSNGRWNYIVEIERKGAGVIYTAFFAGGDPVDARDSIIRCNLNCVLEIGFDSLISIKLRQQPASTGINSIKICGSELLTPSSLVIIKIGEIPPP